MGRYISGTQGFRYKYVYAKQGSNLRALARASRAGASRFEPLLSASMDALERTDDLPVMEMLREAVRRTGHIGDELGSILSREDRIGTGAFDTLQRAIAETIVPLTAILDEQLPEVAQHMNVCARATYTVTSADHDKLFAYIRQFADKLKPADLANDKKLEAAAKQIGSADGYLPLLALEALAHALRHDLATLELREDMPETMAEDFWPTVRDEWGPPIFGKREPRTPGEWFARGLVSLWAGDKKDAVAALKRCGEERARRWWKALGGKPPAKLAATPTPKRDDKALTKFLTVEDVSDRWAAEPGLALDKLDALLRAHPVIDRADAGVILYRKLREHGDALASAAAALPDGLARRAAEDYLSDKQLDDATGSDDVAATLAELARAQKRGYVGDGAASRALSTVLNHGKPADLKTAFDAITAIHKVDGPVPESPLAYNLACTAARIGRKQDMLAWLRVAAKSGDDLHDALEDSDFAAYHDDRAFKDLVKS